MNEFEATEEISQELVDMLVPFLKNHLFSLSIMDPIRKSTMVKLYKLQMQGPVL